MIEHWRWNRRGKLRAQFEFVDIRDVPMKSFNHNIAHYLKRAIKAATIRIIREYPLDPSISASRALDKLAKIIGDNVMYACHCSVYLIGGEFIFFQKTCCTTRASYSALRASHSRTATRTSGT